MTLPIIGSAVRATKHTTAPQSHNVTKSLFNLMTALAADLVKTFDIYSNTNTGSKKGIEGQKKPKMQT